MGQDYNCSLFNDDLTIVRNSNGQEYIVGYALKFYDEKDLGTEFNVLPNVVERIRRDALRHTDLSDVRATYNHNDDFILMRTPELRLEPDTIGLKYTIPVVNEVDIKKTVEKIRRGIAKGSSFIGEVVTRLQRKGAGYIRWIERIQSIEEISIVNKPAYKNTAAIVRSEIDDYERRMLITQTKIRQHKHK